MDDLSEQRQTTSVHSEAAAPHSARVSFTSASTLTLWRLASQVLLSPARPFLPPRRREPRPHSGRRLGKGRGRGGKRKKKKRAEGGERNEKRIMSDTLSYSSAGCVLGTERKREKRLRASVSDPSESRVNNPGLFAVLMLISTHTHTHTQITPFVTIFHLPPSSLTPHCHSLSLLLPLLQPVSIFLFQKQKLH